MSDNIDRYEIRREIGRGATSTVYYAYDPRVGREVAIKLMIDPGLTSVGSHRRFEHEAKAIATLEHPTIVPLYDFGSHAGQPYLVMRHMAGGSLSDQLQRGPIKLEDAVVMLSRVASALDQAHRRGIIHRDIKPANILFDQYGSGFLSDFGIVQMPSSSRHTPSNPSDTGITGTPAYMSPEQLQGDGRLDGRTDVYSLGAVLYETLTCQWPYTAESAFAMALKHINEPPPSILALRPDLPEELDSIIQRAMSKRRGDRYPTAGAMVDDLLAATGESMKSIVDRDTSAFALRPPVRSLTAEGSITSDSEPGTLILPGHRKRSRWGMVAVASTLLALIALAAYAVRQMPDVAAAVPPVIESTAESQPGPTAAVTPFGGGAGRIAFDSEIGGVPDIYLINADGSDTMRIITEIGDNRGVDWSPDGRLLLFRSLDGENRVIYTMNPDGSGLTPLTDPESSNYSPVWSPDGSQIAFVSERDGNPEIYRMNADGSGLTRLTDDPSPDYRPAWSPDGSHIAFHGGRDGDLNVYVMEADGSHPVRLTDSPTADYDATWSPDGSRIAYVTEDDGDAEIWVMDPDGTDKQRLTDNDSGDVSPAWSPDGTRIAFVARRDGNAEIYVMNADGSHQRRLTTNEAEDLDPIWQP